MAGNTGARVAAGAPKAGGGLWWAPLGSTLPTDATTALDAAFVCLGPVSEDGVTPGGDANVESVPEWDGHELASLLTTETRTFEATLLGALDEDVLKFIYGAENVTVTPAAGADGTTISIMDKGGQLPKGVLVIETRYGAKQSRDVCPVVQPTVTERQAYTKGGLKGWTCEFSAQKDEDGVFSYPYHSLDDAPGV